MSNKLNQAIVEARFSDIVRGQPCVGSRGFYRFLCPMHGEYRQRLHHHGQRHGCPRCAVDARRVNHTGERFGHWLVLGMTIRVEGRYRRTVFTCRCDCGLVKEIRGQKLGRSSACWRCLNRTELGHTRRLPGAMGMRNEILARYKRKAQTRGYAWTLTDSDFDFLTAQDCFYCGAKPASGGWSKRHYAEIFRYTGIDRQDNAIGYTKENCVSCCALCNEWKRTRTIDEFVGHARRIAEKQNG